MGKYYVSCIPFAMLDYKNIEVLSQNVYAETKRLLMKTF